MPLCVTLAFSFPCVRLSSVGDICAFLEENHSRVGCQVAGLEEAGRLIQSKGQAAAPALVPRTVAAMTSYAANVFVQVAGEQHWRAV